VVEAEPCPGPRKKLLMMSRDSHGRLVLIGEELSTGTLEVLTVSVTPAICPPQVAAAA
jgi:hypothetical protein